MLKNLLGVASSERDEKNYTTRNNTNTNVNVNGIISLPTKSNKTLFPLIDDDAGLLLSSEAPHEGIELQVDEDELADHLLVQFPSYGTRSQALTNSSTQWQDKTADWLLGGTAAIPTPKQQQLQLLRQQQQQQMSSNSSVLPATTAEENHLNDGGVEGIGISQRSNNKSNNNRDGGDDNNNIPQQQKLVNSRDWSTDEQLLWKSPLKITPIRNNSSTNSSCDNYIDSSNMNLKWQPRNNNNNNNNNAVLKLKEHEITYQKPVLDDPSRDFIAAYYYHVGVMPKLNRFEPRRRIYVDSNNKNETNNEDGSVSVNNKPQQMQQQEIVKHKSPFVNFASNDMTSFGGGGRALSNILEETEDEDEDDDAMNQQYLMVSSSADPNSMSNNVAAGRKNDTDIKKKSSAVSITDVAWMPDRLCKTCYSCDTPFTVFRYVLSVLYFARTYASQGELLYITCTPNQVQGGRVCYEILDYIDSILTRWFCTYYRRRHHCRICGQVFCNTCSGYFVPASSSSPLVSSSASSWQKLSLSPSSPKRYSNNQHQYQIGAPSSPGRNNVPQSSSSTNGNNSNNNSNNNIILRTCKMCFDQVTAQQQKQEKLNAAEVAAAADAADRKRRNTKEQVQQGTSSGGTEMVTTTPQKLHTPSNNGNTTTVDGFSSQLQNLHGDDEESSVLRQWSKIIGAEGNIYNANRRLRTEQDKLEQEEKETDATEVLSPLVLKKRQTSQSSSSSSLANFDRSSIVQEGNHHLGLTAAIHLEQMTASLLETDAPILWKKLCEEIAADKDRNIRKEDVNNFHSKWVNKLMSLATRCCATVDPNIKRGDMLDVRPYVKIKGM
jgi:hypothetical protein